MTPSSKKAPDWEDVMRSSMMRSSMVRRFGMLVLLVAHGGCGGDPCDDDPSCMTDEQPKERQRQLFPNLNADYSKAFRLHSYKDSSRCLQVAGFLVQSGQSIIGEK